MDYQKIQVECSAELSEILIALFSTMPFDTFQENETGFEAFIPNSDWEATLLTQIESFQGNFDFKFSQEFIPAQNWNAVWEANFQPIEVGKFCGIRADFHPAFTDVEHEIIINPKMAFGTGHHATTFLVIQIMESLNFQNAEVLDYGCGTGILAVLASKLGAKEIEAVDIELPSFENTIENSQINSIPNIHAIHGTLENIKSQNFDVILANINRNVILDSFPSLLLKLKKGGKLIISGILKEDEILIKASATKAGFIIEKTLEKDNWVAMELRV